MTDNTVRGEHSIVLNGETLTLRYDWNALSKIRKKYGGAEDLNELETLADILAIGVERSKADITLEYIMELSPPIVPITEAVTKALQAAYWGAEGPPTGDQARKLEEEVANPPMAPNRAQRRAEASKPRSRQPSELESSPATSGA